MWSIGLIQVVSACLCLHVSVCSLRGRRIPPLVDVPEDEAALLLRMLPGNVVVAVSISPLTIIQRLKDQEGHDKEQPHPPAHRQPHPARISEVTKVSWIVVCM